MDAPSRRISSGRGNSLLARHQRHGSLGDKVLHTLTLKTDEHADCSGNVAALGTNRKSASEQIVMTESSDELAKSNSQMLAEKAAQNNRNQYIKMLLQAFTAIKNIKAINDTDYQQYLSNLKWAKHYYISWMSLEITKDANALEKMAEHEFKELEDTFDKKIALIAVAKK
jgi:hypothetical protein